VVQPWVTGGAGAPADRGSRTPGSLERAAGVPRGRRAARPAGPAGAPLDTLPTQSYPPSEALAACTRRWADLSEPAKDLLLKMLDYDPAKRITSKQARAPHSPTVSLTLPYL